MEFKVVPYSVFAEGYVTPEEADLIESMIDDDLRLKDQFIDTKINPQMHNFVTTAKVYAEMPGQKEVDINWDKYLNILSPYIEDFLGNISSQIISYDTTTHLNVVNKDMFVAPHYDGGDKSMFALIYCPRNYDIDNPPCTSYQISEKYHQTFGRYDKMPMAQDHTLNIYHERGKYFIFPGNMLHWVSTVTDEVERITLVTQIIPHIKP